MTDKTDEIVATVDAYCIEGAAAELRLTRSQILRRIINEELDVIVTLGKPHTRLISGASVRRLKAL